MSQQPPEPPGASITGGSIMPDSALRFDHSMVVQAQPHQQAIAIFDGHGHAALITDLTDLEDLPFTGRQRTILATRLRAIADELDRKADQ